MNLHVTTQNTEEYNAEVATVIARIMCQFQECNDNSGKKFHQFVQTYILKQGIKKFEKRGTEAEYKEVKQLHERIVFEPVKIESLKKIERKRAMGSLIFLTEKRDGRVKARVSTNDSIQRSYIPKDDELSSTATTESILITGELEAKQKRDVITMDIPNAFVQTAVPQGKIDEKIIMKLRGALVDMLIDICPGIYEEFIVYERNQKVLYVKMLKALYGILKASILYYQKFRTDIESIGYLVNLYDACVANKIINDKQHTLIWHIDDVNEGHVYAKVNDKFHRWCESKYDSEK